MNSTQLQTWLADALQARHLLRTGAAMASVSYAGRTVSYTQASASELDAYIADLQARGDSTGRTGRRTYRVEQTGRGL